MTAVTMRRKTRNLLPRRSLSQKQSQSWSSRITRTRRQRLLKKEDTISLSMGKQRERKSLFIMSVKRLPMKTSR